MLIFLLLGNSSRFLHAMSLLMPWTDLHGYCWALQPECLQSLAVFGLYALMP